MVHYTSRKYIAWSFPKNTASLYMIFKKGLLTGFFWGVAIHSTQFSVFFAFWFAANNAISGWLFSSNLFLFDNWQVSWRCPLFSAEFLVLTKQTNVFSFALLLSLTLIGLTFAGINIRGDLFSWLGLFQKFHDFWGSDTSYVSFFKTVKWKVKNN